MAFIFWFLLILLCAYAAYRAIRGGFERPQSERLTGYGIVGCIVLFFVALYLINSLFD